MTGMFAVLIAGTPTARAESVSFEGDAAGAAPTGWVCGSTGGGAPRWTVENETVTPDARKVLQQSGSAPFPVREARHVVRRRRRRGALQAVGRARGPGGRHRLALEGRRHLLRLSRQCAREQRLALLHEGGRRRTIKYVDAPVAGNAWHTLRAEFKGTHVKILLDARPTSSSMMAISRAPAVSACGRRRTA